MLSAAPIFAQDAIILDDIVVSATLSPTEQSKTGSSITLFSEDDLNVIGNGRLTDVMSKKTGVFATSTGGMGATSNLYIRGLSSSYISTYVDGIDVSDPAGTRVQYDDFGGLLNSNVRSLEIVKGSQSALYGANAIGGVLTLDTLGLEKSEDGAQQLLDFKLGSKNTASLSYSYVNRIGALSTSFNVARYQTDGISSASLSNVDHPNANLNSEQDSFEKNRIALGVAYDFTDSFTVGANVFKEDGKYEFDEFYANRPTYGPIDGTHDEHGTRNALGYRLYADVSLGSWDHKLTYSNYTIDRFATSPTVAATNTSGTYQSKFKGSREKLDYIASGNVSENLSISIGASMTKEVAENDKLLEDTSEIDTNAIFAEAIYDINQDTSVIANARLEDNSAFGTNNSFRLAASHFVTDTTILRGSVSNGYRTPSADELYGQYPEQNFRGNPDLKTENSTSYEIGFDTLLGSNTRLSATAFKTDMKNKTQYIWDTSLSVGYMVNLSESQTTGVEFTFDTQLTDDTSLTANWTRVDTVDGDGARVAGAPSRTFTLALNHSFSDKFSGGLSYSMVKGIVSEDSNFSLLDVNVNYKINDVFEAYLNLDNAMDIDYETASGYQSPGRMIFAGVRASF